MSRVSLISSPGISRDFYSPSVYSARVVISVNPRRSKLLENDRALYNLIAKENDKKRTTIKRRGKTDRGTVTEYHDSSLI